MPVFYDFICSQKVWDPSHCSVITHQLLPKMFFFPPVPNHETGGDFLSNMYFDTLIPTSPSARHWFAPACLQGIAPHVPQALHFGWQRRGWIHWGSAARSSPVCGDKFLCSLIWLSKDLRMLQCHARVFAGDVSDDTFLYVTA